MTASSSHTASTSGTRAAVSRIARSRRASRRTSCALGGSGGRGGRRTTRARAPRRTRYVTFEWPSPSGSTPRSPVPSPCASRNDRSGSTTSSGGRSLAAASAWVETMSSGAVATVIGPRTVIASVDRRGAPTRAPPQPSPPQIGCSGNALRLPLMRRIAPSILAVCALIAVALPAAAHASHSQSMTFEAPVDLANPGTRTQAFDEISSFGVKSVRIVMLWQNVAPAATSRVRPDFDATDPTKYDWSAYDPQVDGAVARGWNVLLTVSGPVPRWATNGAKDNLTRPKPKEFQAFVTAAARHFGAKVTRWSIWNEPNQPQFLLPQYSAVKHTPLSPRIYRNLFFAAQRGLRAGGLPNAQVLIGETSPRGTGAVVAPLTFLRGVFCLDSKYRKVGKCAEVHAAGYAHHAYTTAQGPLFRPKQPNDVTIGAISRLVSALHRAASAHAVASRLPIHLTEFGIQSTPDPIVGVSQARQSDYLAIAERLAYDQPRIVAFSQYLLRDHPPQQGVP